MTSEAKKKQVDESLSKMIREAAEKMKKDRRIKPVFGPMLDVLVEMLVARSVHPKYIYAVKKCGFLVTEDNHSRLTQEQAQQYALAIKEYQSLEVNSAKTVQ